MRKLFVEKYCDVEQRFYFVIWWNTTIFSSGTYFARFTAMSLSKNETYSEVKKLLFMK